MKHPRSLVALVALLVSLAFGGLVADVYGHEKYLDGLTSVSLILTLAALVAYAYYTYILAKDTVAPSASFALRADPNDPFHFFFVIRNHSKFNLRCWCKLNASVYGQAIQLDGFYGGKTSFAVQPFGSAQGHFFVEGDLLSKAGHTILQMNQNRSAANAKSQLYLRIEFWYKSTGTGRVVHNEQQRHFFDFQRKVMIADF